jgi:hypothetical protein
VILELFSLGPGLPLVSFVLDEAALSLCRGKLHVSGKTGLHFRTAISERLSTPQPIPQGLRPVTVPQTVFAE